jgi:PAS domain S-box-containing protein
LGNDRALASFDNILFKLQVIQLNTHTFELMTVLRWAVPFSIALFAAALFGLAAYKVRHSRIKQKGLILVSAPLVFLLIFVVVVTELTRKSEKAQERYLHSKEVVMEAESLLADLVDAEGSVRGYVLTGDPTFAEAYYHTARDLPKQADRLKTLVGDNPVQEARASELCARASEKMEFLRAAEQFMRVGARDKAVEKIKSGEGLRIMNEFRRSREDFLKEEQRLDAERHEAAQNSWQRFNWLLVAGSAIDLFLAVILAILFSGGISKRIVTLTENAKALAEGKPLTEAIQGTDEIAHLDRVFREIAKALEEAARQERAFSENALDVICSFDAEGRFLKVSPSSFKVWGYLPEELIGRRYTEFVIHEEIEKSEQAEQAVLAGKALTDFENRYRRKNGTIVDMMWSASWSGTDKVMFAIARDITERKRDEAAMLDSEERYRLLFESNPHPIWVYDLDTLTFLAVNPAAIQRYGYSREEFLAMTIKDIRPPEDLPALLEHVSKVSSGRNDSGSWRHRKKDGEIIDVEITSHQLIFSGRNAEIVLANDITERKRAETAIRRLNEDLENRTVQLEAANKELEAFSYSVSHDLRAPLRAIDGFSRILVEDYSENLDADARRVLDVIRGNSQNMGRLIDDLLAFSRLGRKQVERSLIDMKELAADVSRQVTLASAEKEICLNLGSLPPAHGDPALIRQVFINLFSNAAKYSKPKEAVVIDVDGYSENGEQVYYVKDNGVGFDMNYANKLFGVFQRLHSAEEFEGTGVGLAIVQRIVHRHGGRVWADGKVNEGATFFFTLPKEPDVNGKTKHE